MDKVRKQWLLGVFVLVVLFGVYVGWSEWLCILLYYSGQVLVLIVYSYKEQGVEIFFGEIWFGQVCEFLVKLFGGSDYWIVFFFYCGEEKYVLFSIKLGWGILDLYVDIELSVLIQLLLEGLIQQ